MKQVNAVNESVVAAHRKMASAPARPTRIGRTPDIVALKVARKAGKIFEHVTGRSPARSTERDRGEPVGFVVFLADVFVALGIAANAEHFARRSLEESRK